MDLDKKVFRLVRFSNSIAALRRGAEEATHTIGWIEFSHTLTDILMNPSLEFSVANFEANVDAVMPTKGRCRIVRYPLSFAIEVQGEPDRSGKTPVSRFYLSDAPEKYSVVMSLLFSVEAGDREGDSLKACDIRRALWRRLNSMDDAELREAVGFESSEPVIEDM